MKVAKAKMKRKSERESVKTLCEGSVHVALVSLLSDFAPGFRHGHEKEDAIVIMQVNYHNNIDNIVELFNSDDAVSYLELSHTGGNPGPGWTTHTVL